MRQFDIVSTQRDANSYAGNDEWIVFLGIMGEVQLLSGEALVEVCFETEDLIVNKAIPDDKTPSESDIMAQREMLILAMQEELNK